MTGTTSTNMPEWAIAWAMSRNDPYLFATKVLGIPPPGSEPVDGIQALEPWQAEVFGAIRDGHKRISIRSGHGCKKSATLSILVIWGLLTHTDCKIPVVAGSQSQLRDTIWPEIGFWVRRLPQELREQIEVQMERVVIKAAPEEAFAVARTASKDNPDAMQGFHAKFLLFVVDEASGVAEKAYEVAQGALSTDGAIAVLAGNPTKANGFFHATHTTLRDRWYTMRVSSEDVPTARGHIEDVIATYGKESNAYRVRVLGEFPTSDDVTVVPLELVEAAVNREVAPMSVRPVWGVDPARFGDDRSALAKRKGNVLLEPIKTFKNMDTMQLAGRIVREFDNTPLDEQPHEICIDAIGIGAGVADRLDELGLPVRAVNVAESASDDDQYLRLRDEIYWKMRKWFEARDCRIPRDDALIAEITAPTYDFTSAGKLVVESKKDFKKRLGRSPDLSDALMLTFCADDRQRMNADRHRRTDSSPTSPWAA